MAADTTPDPAAQAAAIGAGYDRTAPHLALGAVVVGGTAYPADPITMPLSMPNRHGLVAGATGTGKTLGRELTRSLFGTSKRRR
jgi:hypothetical protein